MDPDMVRRHLIIVTDWNKPACESGHLQRLSEYIIAGFNTFAF